MAYSRLVAGLAAGLGFILYGLATPVGAAEYQLDSELDSGVTQGCATQVTAPAPHSQASSGAIKVLPPSKGLYVGAYQIPATRGEFKRFKDATGRVPPIVFSFHDWFSETNNGTDPDKTFSSRMEGEDSVSPLELAKYLADQGSVLALAWAVYCCDVESTQFWLRMKRPHDHINRILRGEQDDFIRETARQIKKSGVPIMLTIMPEFNWQGQFLFGADGRTWMDAADNICAEYGDPAWPDGPERVRDLYMHVIDVFREEGVTNVTWFMYSGNQYMAKDVEGQSQWLHPRYYYPGDAYIDWVGQSVYFTDPSWSDRYEEVESFKKVFQPGYEAWRSVTKRPMLLAEFGMLAESSDDRQDLWNEVLTKDLKKMPGVKAITIADSDLFAEYFNIPRLSGSDDDLSVLKRVSSQDSYFSKSLKTGPSR